METEVINKQERKHDHRGWTPQSTSATSSRDEPPNTDDGDTDWNSNQRNGESSPASLRWHDRLRARGSKYESWAGSPITGHTAPMAVKTPLPITPSADDNTWPRATPRSLILSPPTPANLPRHHLAP
ncbi:hypothetical protein RHMOL_Rhmol09G0047300 [Rhododendron molle]|uniref:Uncharacterized protein n=1 Tax=Rhododendron molle TaxID=49168 RepID=A0ACC0MAZ2_RHOML|nr:hypothetical protein RHMOL_Rhmol09G0047300 [Rhododendron molle]